MEAEKEAVREIIEPEEMEKGPVGEGSVPVEKGAVGEGSSSVEIMERGRMQHVLDRRGEEFLVAWEGGADSWEPRSVVKAAIPAVLKHFLFMRKLHHSNDSLGDPNTNPLMADRLAGTRRANEPSARRPSLSPPAQAHTPKDLTPKATKDAPQLPEASATEDGWSELITLKTAVEASSALMTVEKQERRTRQSSPGALRRQATPSQTKGPAKKKSTSKTPQTKAAGSAKKNLPVETTESPSGGAMETTEPTNDGAVEQSPDKAPSKGEASAPSPTELADSATPADGGLVDVDRRRLMEKLQRVREKSQSRKASVAKLTDEVLSLQKALTKTRNELQTHKEKQTLPKGQDEAKRSSEYLALLKDSLAKTKEAKAETKEAKAEAQEAKAEAQEAKAALERAETKARKAEEGKQRHKSQAEKARQSEEETKRAMEELKAEVEGLREQVAKAGRGKESGGLLAWAEKAWGQPTGLCVVCEKGEVSGRTLAEVPGVAELRAALRPHEPPEEVREKAARAWAQRHGAKGGGWDSEGDDVTKVLLAAERATSDHLRDRLRLQNLANLLPRPPPTASLPNTTPDPLTTEAPFLKPRDPRTKPQDPRRKPNNP